MLVGQGGVLGGEASGHVLCLDRASTGDALVCALQVLEVLVRRKLQLDELASGWSRLPQKTINVRIAPGSKPLQSAAVGVARAQAEASLAGRGRLVLRPSGTEPVVRVTVEADDPQLVDGVLGKLAAAVTAAVP
jgi:phosphoglucosamine mutase